MLFILFAGAVPLAGIGGDHGLVAAPFPRDLSSANKNSCLAQRCPGGHTHPWEQPKASG